MKKWFVVACCLVYLACAHKQTAVSYSPNYNVIEPEKIIERVIKSQPTTYAGAVPFEVSVKSDCIELRTTEQGGFLLFGGGSPGEVRSAIYYKNIGKVVLHKTSLWYIEILDRLEYRMYYVYSFDESDAKLFVDAMYAMMAKQ